MAGAMLPWLRDRPAAMVRFPGRLHGEAIMQKNVPGYFPGSVRTAEVPKQAARCVRWCATAPPRWSGRAVLGARQAGCSGSDADQLERARQALRPGQFTIRTVPSRGGEPWAAMRRRRFGLNRPRDLLARIAA